MLARQGAGRHLRVSRPYYGRVNLFVLPPLLQQDGGEYEQIETRRIAKETEAMDMGRMGADQSRQITILMDAFRM